MVDVKTFSIYFCIFTIFITLVGFILNIPTLEKQKIIVVEFKNKDDCQLILKTNKNNKICKNLKVISYDFKDIKLVKSNVQLTL